MTLNGIVVVMTCNSHRWSPGSISQGSQIYSILLWQNWTVETMGKGITRLCTGDVSWLLQNEKYWGCANSGTGVCWLTVADEWWISSTACVAACWKWVHWQRGTGCLGGKGSYLMFRKSPWNGSRIWAAMEGNPTHISQLAHSLSQRWLNTLHGLLHQPKAYLYVIAVK